MSHHKTEISSSKLKVLVIGPFPPPINGCSNANAVLFQELSEKLLQAEFVNTTGGVNAGSHGKFGWSKVLSFLHVYRNLSKISKFSVVYLTPGQTFLGVLKYAPFILCCLLLHKPYVIHIHGSYLGKEYELLRGNKKKLFHYLISKASAGIVLSKSLVEVFTGLLPKSKVQVVENFVEEELTRSIPVKKTDKLRILFLSNLLSEKGIFELLEALELLQQRGVNFEAKIAGSAEPNILAQVNLSLSRLHHKVQYVGTVRGIDKYQVLSEANILVLPTYYKMEGQPIALLEGMAAGNIIVTTRHAGIPDIVSNSNGFLLTPGSSQEIADCLEAIHCDLPNLVKKFSESNRHYAAETFSVSKFATKIINVLHDSTTA